ncbi:hypothetical protein E4T56_gene10349 [Termitomyces sp. T112]|nr:hypothetical protein E4T56_gene10349 [Termitomyces sp. T112]
MVSTPDEPNIPDAPNAILPELDPPPDLSHVDTDMESAHSLQKHSHRPPQHLVDYLPSDPHPLCQFSKEYQDLTEKLPTPPPPALFETDPNEVGLFCCYTVLPSQDPDQELTIHHVGDAPTFVQETTAATRPDFAVGLLVWFQNSPGPAHWRALAHVMQYVNGTLDYHTTYQREADITPTGYVDADYGGDLDTHRSTGGQPTMALSTTEAKYMALTCGAQQAALHANLHVGNSPALSLALYTKGHARAKHIDIRHYYIRERVKLGEIEGYPYSTQNSANLFTKPLGRIAHSCLVGLLGLKPQLESGRVLV